jgi:hypothetical protein
LRIKFFPADEEKSHVLRSGSWTKDRRKELNSNDKKANSWVLSRKKLERKNSETREKKKIGLLLL